MLRPDHRDRRGLSAALTHRVFALELAAYLLASASMGVATVVVSVALFRRGGTAEWATVGVVARVAPFVMLSAVSGALADRCDQRRLLPFAFGAQAVIAAVLAASVGSAPLVAVAAIGFLANAAWTVSYPSMAALVPRLVGDRELPAANGLLSTVESLAWIGGPGLGGLLVTAVGVRTTSLAQIALAATGAAMAAWAARRRDEPHENADDTGRVGGRESVLGSLRAGVAAVRANSVVHRPLALLLVSNFVYGATQVLLLVAAWKRLGMSEGGYGALCAGIGGGALLALLLVPRIAAIERTGLVLSGSVLLGAVPLAALAVVETPAVGIALLAVSGLGLVLTEVVALTALQRNVPRDRTAGIFGLVDSLSISCILLGSLVVAPLIRVVGLEWSLVISGALVPVVAVIGVRRLSSRTERTAAEPYQSDQLALGGSSPGAAVRSYVLNRDVGSSSLGS